MDDSLEHFLFPNPTLVHQAVPHPWRVVELKVFSMSRSLAIVLSAAGMWGHSQRRWFSV